MPSRRVDAHRPAILALALASAVLALAACGGSEPPAPKQAGGGSSTTPAETPERGITPRTARPQTQTSAPPPPEATRPVRARPPAPSGLKAEDATGKTDFALELSQALRLGGFHFELSFDGDRFVAGEPVLGEAFKGYLCAANTGIPGRLNYQCAGIPKEEKGGLVATVPIFHRDAPAALSDLEVTVAQVVGETGDTADGVELRFKQSS